MRKELNAVNYLFWINLKFSPSYLFENFEKRIILKFELSSYRKIWRKVWNKVKFDFENDVLAQKLKTMLLLSFSFSFNIINNIILIRILKVDNVIHLLTQISTFPDL